MAADVVQRQSIVLNRRWGDTIPTIAVIVPSFRGGDLLRRSLQALLRCDPPPDQLLVVQDGPDEVDSAIVAEFNLPVVVRPVRGGVAAARNTGVAHTTADVLFFVDADVEIHPDAVGIAARTFQADPQLAALFGSYDDNPGHPSFLSQYRNLLHHYVHQTSHEIAFTFWGGFGAIRREVLKGVGGFREGWPRWPVEDIDLGYRLRRGGAQVRLVKTMLTRHNKHWTWSNTLFTDTVGRAWSWTWILLREREIKDDLNLKWSERLSVALAGLTVACLLVAPGWPAVWPGVLLFPLCLWTLHLPFYLFLSRLRGPSFIPPALVWHFLFYVCAGLGFGLGIISYPLDVYQRRRLGHDEVVLHLDRKDEAA